MASVPGVASTGKSASIRKLFGFLNPSDVRIRFRALLIWSTVIWLAGVAALFWLVDMREAMLVRAIVITFFACALTATLFAYFLSNQWYVRRRQFKARLHTVALVAYLRNYWYERAVEERVLWDHVIDEGSTDGNAERLIDRIYNEQYGWFIFARPFVLLLALVFANAALVSWLYDCSMSFGIGSPACTVLGANPILVSSCISGAFMFVIGDCAMSVNQGTLSIVDVYWYALRLTISIPLGVALGSFGGTTAEAHTLVAFGLGALPVDEIQKLLRRLTTGQLQAGEAKQEVDQLLNLEGMTVPISALLAGHGIRSIAQLEASDPVLLGARTGLKFDFTLQLASQAIVRGHIGAQASVLVPIGLHKAHLISELVDGLDDPDPRVKGWAAARLELATQRWSEEAARTGANAGPVAVAAIEAIFRQIARTPYTVFLRKVMQ